MDIRLVSRKVYEIEIEQRKRRRGRSCLAHSLFPDIERVKEKESELETYFYACYVSYRQKDTASTTQTIKMRKRVIGKM